MAIVKVGVSNMCFFWRLGKTFEVAQELNLSGVEIYPTRWTGLRTLKRAVEKYGVDILSIHTTFHQCTIYGKIMCDVEEM